MVFLFSKKKEKTTTKICDMRTSVVFAIRFFSSVIFFLFFFFAHLYLLRSQQFYLSKHKAVAVYGIPFMFWWSSSAILCVIIDSCCEMGISVICQPEHSRGDLYPGQLIVFYTINHDFSLKIYKQSNQS